MIAKALRACKQVLEQRQEGDRMIILVSDGESFDLHNNADELARDLRIANISVFAIIIGVSRIQNEILHITGTTGGEAFEVGDPDALKTVFKRIDEMKQAKLEKSFSETLDNYEPFCIAGLALLGLTTVSLFGLRYTPW
jgi:Ca-activated chloride channel family protein